MESQNSTTNTAQTVSSKTAKKQPEENVVKEFTKFTLLALAIILPIRLLVIQPFIVSGASMDPTFKSGQYLMVDQLTYRFHEPNRGDVVIFRYPRDPRTFYIKRVIGLPGETIKAENGKVTIINKENPTGLAIDDKYVAADNRTSEDFSTTLGETEYYVMGDNRAESSDSRAWGPLDRKYIVGRPAVRLYPVTQLGFFPGK